MVKLAIGLGAGAFWIATAFAQPMQTPYIAKWYNNKDAAVSLRFDDNLKSHVRFVIPLLNKYGIKASFMVSPGKRNFKQHDDFWKHEVPAMGHDLGNHTMHHRGAGNIEAADYEIGEATKILTKLYPDRGELLLFASGGGKKWGGERWGNADDNYKSLVNKYNLIDLYDGDHPAFAVDNKTPVNDLLAIIHKSLSTNSHTQILFHTVGKPNTRDLLRQFIKGIDITFSEIKFEKFIEKLITFTDRIWIASLLDILKYQWEYDHSVLTVTSPESNSIEMDFIANFNTELYNHPLTLVIPISTPELRVYQDNSLVHSTPFTVNGFTLINIAPKNSTIRIEGNLQDPLT